MTQRAPLYKEQRAMARTEERCVLQLWFALEPDQQTLIAAVDLCDDWIRRIVIENFFDLPGLCRSCDAVRRIHWIPTVADFLIRCNGWDCRSVTPESVELKPLRANRHWSSALRDDFLRALDLGVIQEIAGTRLWIPGPHCGPGRCGGCPHPLHYRNGGPALPQVVMAYLAYESHVRVLLSSADTATTAYKTTASSFTIRPEMVSTRLIEARVIATMSALRPFWDAGAISVADQFRLRHMFGAVWSRLPWVPWEEIGRLRGPMLPPWAALAAPAYVIL